jgi:hypothetical protein
MALVELLQKRQLHFNGSANFPLHTFTRVTDRATGENVHFVARCSFLGLYYRSLWGHSSCVNALALSPLGEEYLASA